MSIFRQPWDSVPVPSRSHPSFHFVIANDDFTKFGNGGELHDTKIWGGVTISWSKALGAAKEEAKE